MGIATSAAPGLLLLAALISTSCAPSFRARENEVLVLHGGGSEATLTLVALGDDAVPRPISDGLEGVVAVAVSPDGLDVAFGASSNGGPGTDLFLVERDDLERRLLARVPGPIGGAAFLPDGTLVFSASDPAGADGHELFHVSGDAPPTRLTFEAGVRCGPVLLTDGRLLFARASTGTPADRLLVVHPDGTGMTPYAELPDGSGRVVSLAADDSGDLAVLTRDDSGRPALWTVDVDRPRATGVRRIALDDRQVHDVHWTPAGSLLLAADGEVLVADDQEIRTRWNAPDGHPVLAVRSLEGRARPSPHLSLVDPEGDTAELFCMDVRRSRIETVRHLPDQTQARFLTPDGKEVLSAPVFEDGSFAATVPADRPLRIELVSDRGEVLAAETHSFFLRPGERRGCIGCHESRLSAAPNQMPLALRAAAVPPTTPPVTQTARRDMQ